MQKKDIKKFNRFELKYILSLEQAETLKKDLINYIIPDSNAQNGKYTLASLYYDTPDYRFYWEKIEGLKFRRKIRIRRYVTNEVFTEDSVVYVEIKQRIDRVTQKRRVSMSYRDAKNLIEQYEYPESYDPKDQSTLDEIIELSKKAKLEAKIITLYDREAYFGTEHDAGLRMTFDTSISYQKTNLDLKTTEPEGYMIPVKFTILEIKANEKIPYWITEMIANHNIKLIRISKYCQGLEASNIFPKSLHHIHNS